MNEENVSKIRTIIQNMSQDTPFKREAVLDSLYSLAVGNRLERGTKPLESLFDYWLWNSSAENKSAGDFEYSVALAEIEEILVHQGLIYDNGNK